MPTVAELKADKFTFKIHRPTGAYASFEHFWCDIKIKGHKCGYLSCASISPSPHFPLVARFAIKDSEAGGGFKWVGLKVRFVSIEEAKEKLQELFPRIVKDLDLHLFEKEDD